jgi:hypothetical protein
MYRRPLYPSAELQKQEILPHLREVITKIKYAIQMAQILIYLLFYVSFSG